MSAPYFKFFTTDFRDGVRGMKPDEIGVYMLALTLIYDAEGSLPDDDAKNAAKAGVDIRTWRRVRARLLDLGKLHLDDGHLYNRRADVMIAERGGVSAVRAVAGAKGGKASGEARRQLSSHDDRPKIAETLPEDLADFSETSPEDRREVPAISDAETLAANETAEAKAWKPESESDTTTAYARDARGPPDGEGLVGRCIAVAGIGLSRDRTALGATAHVLEAALADGCDLDADILRIVTARTAKARASPIATFAYFARAFREARDARLTTQPDPADDNPDRPRPAGAARQDRRDVAHRERKPHRARPRSGSFVGAAVRAQDRRARIAELERADAESPPDPSIA